MQDLISHFQLNTSALSLLTSAVQFGFIFGTLVFAIFTIADRFSPSWVFFMCALLGASTNLGVLWPGNTLSSLLTFRFLTGFCLAGIYPVGMKITADYFHNSLGKSLGWLVGALVLGTAIPHFIKALTADLKWQSVILTVSGLAAVGGALMYVLVPNGPYRKASQKLDVSAFVKVFHNYAFRKAAYGYFGHMWELYAFWTFVPVILNTYNKMHFSSQLSVPFWSFVIIGIGGLSCVLAGRWSHYWDAKRIASGALLLSGLCCLLSPWMFQLESPSVFLAFMVLWGMAVITDSPMLSSIVAKEAPTNIKGTALTIVNCIGFAITIVSIQCLDWTSTWLNAQYTYLLLGIGPFLGFLGLKGFLNQKV